MTTTTKKTSTAKKSSTRKKNNKKEVFDEFDGLHIATFSNNAYYRYIHNKKMDRIAFIINTLLVIAIIAVIALIINILNLCK